MITIPSDKYGYDLLDYLFSLMCRNDASQNEVKLVHRICKAVLIDGWIEDKEYIQNIKLKDNEKQILDLNAYCFSDNLEIKARFNDLARINNPRHNEMSIIASDTYLELYNKKADWKFLVRSLIVRSAKNIDETFLKRYLATIEKSCLYGHALERIINYLNKIARNGAWKPILISYAKRRKEEELSKHAFEQYRGFLNSLFLLGQMSEREKAHAIALGFEMEADYAIAKSGKNEFIMSMDETYKKGLIEIKNYKNIYKDDYNRLCEKVCKQQRLNVEIMGKLEPFHIHIHNCPE